MKLDPNTDYVTGLTDLSHELRERILGCARDEESLIAALRLLAEPVSISPEIDRIRQDLFEPIVYLVANHTPLSRASEFGFRRTTVTFAKRGAFSCADSKSRHTPVEEAIDLECEIQVVGDGAATAEEETAIRVWRRRWREYADITNSGLSAGLWTWNQFLLSAARRPHVLGVDWGHREQTDTIWPSYFSLTPQACHALSLPPYDRYHTEDWRQALWQLSPSPEMPRDLPAALVPLGERWLRMGVVASCKVSPVASAWSLFQLLRSFATWGGECFLSIPIQLGGQESEATCVLSLCTNRRLDEREILRWRSVARDIFQPLIARETEVAIRRNTENQLYIQSVDSVGHALKNRVMPIMTAVNAAEASADEKTLARLKWAKKLTHGLGSFGALLNFLAHISRPGSTGLQSVDHNLVTTAPLEFGRLLEGLEPIVPTLAERSHIRLSLEHHDVLASVRVIPFVWHSVHRQNVRPFDYFYADILYELLTNAANRAPIAGDSVEASARLLDQQFLVVENEFELNDHIQQSSRFRALSQDTWRPARQCVGGGLYFASLALEKASAGEMDLRWTKLSNRRAKFEARIKLKGMETVSLK